MSGCSWWWKIGKIAENNSAVAWPRPFRCGTDSHLRLVQLAVSFWFSDLIVLDDLNPFDRRNLAAPVQGDLHSLPPSCYLLVIRRYHWRDTGLMGLQNSTSAFLGKIALNYKQLLHDRDILPQRNKRLRSCGTDHLAGVRGIGVLLLFPLQELWCLHLFCASCLPCWSSNYDKARPFL